MKRRGGEMTIKPMLWKVLVVVVAVAGLITGCAGLE